MRREQPANRASMAVKGIQARTHSVNSSQTVRLDDTTNWRYRMNPVSCSAVILPCHRVSIGTLAHMQERV
eukprot:355021-Chlamydomonas_euryale.AAC.10